MKIITDRAVYVQKNDIAFLNQTDLDIPASIYLKAFGNSPTTIIDDSNRFDFLKFDDEREIEYFRNLEWIIDYNEVKDLDEEQLMEIGQSIAQTKNGIAKKYNAMSVEKRRENAHMVEECDLLEFKMYSLRDIIWFKQGAIEMTLPEGVSLPEKVTSPQPEEKPKEKGFKKFLNRFRRNNKQ